MLYDNSVTTLHPWHRFFLHRKTFTAHVVTYAKNTVQIFGIYRTLKGQVIKPTWKSPRHSSCLHLLNSFHSTYSLRDGQAEGAFHWEIRRPTGGRLTTGSQWNTFGRLMSHPPAAEKRRARKLRHVVGASAKCEQDGGH